MQTKIGSYYIVYGKNNLDLILDLGIQTEKNKIKTKQRIFKTDNEQDYLDFLNTLNKQIEQ